MSYLSFRLYGCLVVSVLDCQSWGSGFKSRPEQKFSSRFLLHLSTIANSAMMSTLIAHCQWDDETVGERTGNPSSYAKAKKMKSLTLHTCGCPMASLMSWSSYLDLQMGWTLVAKVHWVWDPLGLFHSFIHSGHFYSAPSSPLLLRGAPDYSTDTVSEFHAEAHRQL